MNNPEKPQEQYMLLFNQYKILGVSMAPSSYTPEQIAAQINKLLTTVFKGKDIPDVTDKEVVELQKVIAQNIKDKRKAYEEFKKDNNSSNLSTKLADLTELANTKFDKFAGKAKEKLSAVASVTRDKFTNLGRSAKEMGTSAVESASDAASGATRVLGLSFNTLAQNIQYSRGKNIGKGIAAKVQAKADAKAAAAAKLSTNVERRLLESPAKGVLDDDDDRFVTSNPQDDKTGIKDTKISYITVNGTKLSVSVKNNNNGTITLTFDKSFGGSLYNFIISNKLLYNYDEIKGYVNKVNTIPFSKANVIANLSITVSDAVYTKFNEEVLNQNKEWTLTLSKENKVITIPGTWSNLYQVGGKRRRHTIKKNRRSIRRTTIRRKQYKNKNKKNRSFKR